MNRHLNHAPNESNRPPYPSPSGDPYRQGSPEEIDLFDILFAIRRRWQWVMGAALCSTIATTLFVVSRPISYKLSVPIELPSDDTYSQFILPRLAAGDGDTLSLIETPLLNKTIIMDTVRAAMDDPYVKNQEERGFIQGFDLNPIEDATKGRSLVFNLSGKDPKLVAATMDQFLIAVNTQIHTKMTLLLEERVQQVKETKIKLHQFAVENLEKKIVLKQGDIDTNRLTILNKISALEAEASAKKQNELVLIEEKRKVDRLEIELRLKALHNLAVARREDRIARYTEALNIAEKLGIEGQFIAAEPQSNEAASGGTPAPSSSAEGKDGSPVREKVSIYAGADNKPLYMRGKSDLRAELIQMKDRNNDSAIVPEIRELENGLPLVKNDVQYEILKSRTQDKSFIIEVPALKAQLEFLDKDAELASLKKMASTPKLIDYSIKELPFLDGDLIRTQRLLEVTKAMTFTKASPKTPQMVLSTKKSVMIMAGLFAGLLVGVLAALMVDGWQTGKRMRSPQGYLSQSATTSVAL